MAVPLVGFAVRFKSSPAVAAYDCEYSGYFQSGLTVGPVRNGVPCRSTVANDPLEGIQIRLTKRVAKVSVPDVARHEHPVRHAKKSSKLRNRAHRLSRRVSGLHSGSTRVKSVKRKPTGVVRVAQGDAVAKRPKRAKQGTPERRSRRATSIRRHAIRHP